MVESQRSPTASPASPSATSLLRPETTVGIPWIPTTPSTTGQASPASPSATSLPRPESPGAASPQSANVQLETGDVTLVVDEQPDESLDMDDAGSSASITSIIRAHRFENGRRYHAYKEGAYIAPNDDIEINRLDFQHEQFRLTLGGIFKCPVKLEDVHRVLDCGTGTGVWAIEIADDYPNLEVVGVDLSPIQPQYIPPNVRFYIDDIEDPWTYSYQFDFIYARMLTGLSDWSTFFEQVNENLQPGGWVELNDISMPFRCDDGTMTDDNAILRWSTLCLEASKNLKKPVNSATGYADMLVKAGFVNVKEEMFKWPVNRWPKDPVYKDLGSMTKENITRNLYGLSVALLTHGLGWSVEEVQVFLIEVRNQMNNPRIHAYAPIYVVYGQKPIS